MFMITIQASCLFADRLAVQLMYARHVLLPWLLSLSHDDHASMLCLVGYARHGH